MSRLNFSGWNFNFMAWRRSAGGLSIVLVLISLGSLLVNQLNFAVDFTGGILIELSAEQPMAPNAVRSRLEGASFDGAVVQNFGSQRAVLIRLPVSEQREDTGLAVLTSLKGDIPGVELRRVEFVGPQVGEELAINGGLAIFWTLLCIFIYVLLRFHWKFSAGAVIALGHDVTIVLGSFSLFQWEFDLSVLAALLAVIGYSLNDTIVVFDRCRENFRRKGTADELTLMNRSINEMLGRTLMTSLTTLLVLLSLFLVGGPALHGFSTALIIGVVVGTYSSIYVAGNAALIFGLHRSDLVIPPPPDNLDDSGAQI